MKEVYRILVIFMGEPPTEITWEFMGNNNYKIIKNISPRLL